MKVINNCRGLTKFEDLRVGDVFFKGDNIMMKVETGDEDVCSYNSVDLEFGELFWTPDNTNVRLVSAEIILS